MTKKTIYQDSFLVSGIMCHQGCGNTIRNALSDLENLKTQRLLPDDAEIIIDAEPQGLGIHRLFITIESTVLTFKSRKHILARKFKEKLDNVGFETLKNNLNNHKDKTNPVNQINILVNLASILSIIILSVAFPPSLLLTIGLTALSFLTTAFTARHYLLNFYRNLRQKNLADMATSITLGWLVALIHTLYHAISMPLANSFSMTFMSYIMPVMLITIINGMDEMKRLVLNQTKKMQLSSMKALFPQMSKDYHSYQLSQQELRVLTNLMKTSKDDPAAFSLSIDRMLNEEKLITQSKNTLAQGMLIKIKRGECFPVDGIIIRGNTLIDASILTGEPQQEKQLLDTVPAGAINLGPEVTIYASADCYNSAVNKLLFRSNRARQTANSPSTSNNKFSYFYGALIIAGIAASILTPVALGIFTIPLVLQNVTGILFAICPCTIAIAHELPKLLSVYRRHHQGILIRDDNFTDQSNDIHTVIFDKTGTLTTGNSQVDSSEGVSSSLWQRIYLLEKNHGADHPLAKAINHYCETRNTQQMMIKDITNVASDTKNRGLSAIVQGKKIHIGNLDYLRDTGMLLPAEFPASIQHKIAQGLTPVYVAENNVYQGVILIKHEVRKNVLAALTRLKNEGKKLIMLTGDSKLSATGFNQQNGAIFDPDDIHAEHSPQDKESYLQRLMSEEGIDPKGVWFVGDGLNDAPCARVVNDKGGVSASMTSDDKAAFFTDISLNGSLDYLFEHNKLNRFLKKITAQNQWLLAYGAIAFLAFIIGFSAVGVAVSPLIPMFVMVSTTLLTLFNSYRVKFSVDNALDKNATWLNRLLASDLSIGSLIGASSLLICGILISTIATGGLAFPAIVFTAGTVAAISSACLLAASALFGGFALFGTTHFLFDRYINKPISGADSTHISIQQDNIDLDGALPIERTYQGESEASMNKKLNPESKLKIGFYHHVKTALEAEKPAEELISLRMN